MRMEIESLESIKSEWVSVASAKKTYIPKEVSREIDEVKRVIRLFDSKKDIVVCVGMLKSGKSTLINLLARHPEASPTEQGIDKTLRPALFRMLPEGKEPVVRIYYHIEAAEHPVSRMGAFKRLIEYLCGVSEEFPAQYIEERTEKLERRILEEVLCRKVDETRFLTKEPLFVVIDLPHDPESLFFQNQERMLLDMPGCDSGHSETTKQQEGYSAIGDECAMVLLLQTNLSPLNRNAMDQLRQIFAGRHEKTIRIILNRIDSRIWRTEQSIHEENECQLFDARRQLKEVCGEITPAWNEANLAMATDGMFASPEKIQKECKLYGKEYRGKEDLWNGSYFKELEQNVVENLNDIRVIHCLDRLRKGLRALIDECKSQEEMILNKMAAGKKKKEDWTSLVEFAEGFYAKQANLTQGWRYHLKQPPDFDRICESVWGNDPKIKTGDGMKVRGDDIDKCMASCNDKCFARYEKIANNNVALSDIMVECGGGAYAVLYAAVDDKLKKIFAELREKARKKYSCWEEIAETQRPTAADLNEVGIRIIKDASVENKYVVSKQFAGRKEVFFGLWKTAKKYVVSSKTPVFDEPILKPMVKHYEDQLEKLDMEYVRGNVNQLMEQKFNEVINKLSDYIQHNHIEELEAKYKRLESKKTELTVLREETEKHLEELEAEYKKLDAEYKDLESKKTKLTVLREETEKHF